MNKVILIGRLTRDPDFRSTANSSHASFSVAVDRKYKQDGQPDADFPRVVAWGKTAEFINKYFSKGMRIGIEGRIQTGSYQNQNGDTVYTTDVVVEAVEFVESKSSSSEGKQQSKPSEAPQTDDSGFMNITDDYDDLPF